MVASMLCKKWGRRDWPFEENPVDFSYSNVVIKDGYLILCLTTKNKSGFHGKLEKDE